MHADVGSAGYCRDWPEPRGQGSRGGRVPLQVGAGRRRAQFGGGSRARLPRVEGQMTHAARGLAAEHWPKRGIGGAILDPHTRAGRGVFGRTHRFELDDQIMQPARAREAHLKCCLQRTLLRSQAPARGRTGDNLQVWLGTQPGPAAEEALEVKLRQLRLGGKLFYRRLLAPVLIHVGQDTRDAGKIARIKMGVVGVHAQSMQVRLAAGNPKAAAWAACRPLWNN